MSTVLVTGPTRSAGVGLVTPLPGGLARPLVESLVNDVVVTDHRIDLCTPSPRSTG